MSTLREIRNRRDSIIGIQQITKAMKLVAASKLRKAQSQLLKARPYSDKLRELINSLSAHTETTHHPLLSKRNLKRAAVLIAGTDRGLCGSFNINIFRHSDNLIKDLAGVETSIMCLGKKTLDYYTKQDTPILSRYINFYEEANFGNAASIGEMVIDSYIRGNLDGVYVVYNEFKNAARQNLTVQQILPLHTELEAEPQTNLSNLTEYIYQPDRYGLLDTVIRQYINIEIWRIILETFAAEQGARMTAMENATENAQDLLAELSKEFNRRRQSAITTELTEIVAGAEALNG